MAVTGRYHGGVNGTLGRRVMRWLLVGLLVLLSSFGVPAILSFARPNRERDDAGIVLVLGRDLPRI